MESRALGRWGEAEAAGFLERQGLPVVDRSYRQKWGELDLIARDGETWVFVEIKTRTRDQQPSALDAVSPRKRRRMILAAMSYMKWKRLDGSPMRFDVIIIVAGRLTWIPNAFEIPSFYTC